MVAMAIESAMIPLPSELILPYAGLPRVRPDAARAADRRPWNFWIVVIVATIGNTLGSLIAYAIGAWGGRPFLERYGKYLLIRHHEIELADHFFERYGAATAFFSRLLPIVRTFISFPAGVARMPLGTFIVYSTAGAFLWSILLVYAGTCARRELGGDPPRAPAVRPADRGRRRPAVVLFIWWRLGMPGGAPSARRRRPAPLTPGRRGRARPAPAAPGTPRYSSRS